MCMPMSALGGAALAKSKASAAPAGMAASTMAKPMMKAKPKLSGQAFGAATGLLTR